MAELTEEGRRRVEDLAARYGTSVDAVRTLLRAVAAGGGTMAQFSHPDLGGMGQWSQGGMVMVGDMFNTGLKAKIDGLCTALSGLLAGQAIWEPQGQVESATTSWRESDWWGADLGRPSSSGAQNGVRYAAFPATRRLAIEAGGRVTIYDTGDHRIGGVSQQQSGDYSLSFTSQYGPVRIDALRVVSRGDREPDGLPPETRQPEPASPEPAPTQDVVLLIERLAALRDRDILSEQEFAAKKAELLGRL